MHHSTWTGQSHIILVFDIGRPVDHGLISGGLANQIPYYYSVSFYMGLPVSHGVILDGLTSLTSWTILHGLANQISYCHSIWTDQWVMASYQMDWPVSPHTPFYMDQPTKYHIICF